MTSAEGRAPSSRSSLVVNLAPDGPRLPTMCTSRTWLAASAASARSGTSVPRSSSAPRARMRATSTATLPTPMTTADRAPRANASGGASGWALYQETKSVAEWLPGRSSPGTPSLRSLAAPTQYTTA